MMPRINAYHVFPTNDTRFHRLEGYNCWCKPRIMTCEVVMNEQSFKLVQEYEHPIVVHNSADGREIPEAEFAKMRSRLQTNNKSYG